MSGCARIQFRGGLNTSERKWQKSSASGGGCRCTCAAHVIRANRARIPRDTKMPRHLPKRIIRLARVLVDTRVLRRYDEDPTSMTSRRLNPPSAQLVHFAFFLRFSSYFRSFSSMQLHCRRWFHEIGQLLLAAFRRILVLRPLFVATGED